MLMEGEDSDENTLQQTLVPELEEDQKEYDSKLDAINDLKEVRESTAPSIYDEKLLDSTGLYNPDLPEQKKQRVSWIASIRPTGFNIPRKVTGLFTRKRIPKRQVVANRFFRSTQREQEIEAKELGLEHQLCSLLHPQRSMNWTIIGNTDETHLRGR